MPQLAPEPSIDEQIAPDGSMSSIRQPQPQVPQQHNEPAPDGDGQIAKQPVIDPNEPAPTETDDKEVSLDDFEEAKINKQKTPPAPKQPKPADDKGEETAEKDDADLTPAERFNKSLEEKKQFKPKDPLQPQQKKFPKTERDYSTIPENLRSHFKNMDNEAFATLSPLIQKYANEVRQKDDTIKKLQEGKEIVPESYYEHERAYMLTPEFERAAMHVNEANVIAQHWEEQLDAVRTGATEYKTIVRDQNGNLAYGQSVPADVRTETDLLKKFNGSQNQLMRLQGVLDGIQGGFKNQHVQAKNWLGETDKSWFAPPFQDEKTPLSIMANEFHEKNLPAVYRNNPLAKHLAKAMVSVQMLGKLLNDANAKASAGGNGNNPKPRRQPTEADLGGEGGDKGKRESEVTVDDFKNRMNGAYIV